MPTKRDIGALRFGSDEVRGPRRSRENALTFGPVVAASSVVTVASGASNVEAMACTAGIGVPTAVVRDSGPGTHPTLAVTSNASADGPED